MFPRRLIPTFCIKKCEIVPSWDVQFLNARVGYISGNKLCKTTTGTNKIEQRIPNGFAWDIFPNPAKNTIHLKYPHLKIHRLTLTDLSGRMIKVFHPESKSLDVSDIAAGLYILQVAAAEGKMAKPVSV